MCNIHTYATHHFDNCDKDFHVQTLWDKTLSYWATKRSITMKIVDNLGLHWRELVILLCCQLFLTSWMVLTLSPGGPSGPAAPASPLGPLLPSSPCGPWSPWIPTGPWKHTPATDQIITGRKKDFMWGNSTLGLYVLHFSDYMRNPQKYWVHPDHFIWSIIIC